MIIIAGTHYAQKYDSSYDTMDIVDNNQEILLNILTKEYSANYGVTKTQTRKQ